MNSSMDRGVFRIFVSSTFVDLEVYRDAVIMAIRRLGHTPVVMEDFTAEDIEALSKCLNLVKNCDLYVGIFAWRYGFIPKGCDRSLTELEYREAEKYNIPTLISILDKENSWPIKHIDLDREKIEILRDELQERKIVSFFTTSDDLCGKMTAAISNTVDDIRYGQRKIDQQYQTDSGEHVVGSIPGATIQHFQGRDSELEKLRHYLEKDSLRMVLVCGRGGIGKTSLVTKFISDIEKISIAHKIGSIVFVSLRQSEFRSPDKLIELIFCTLPPEIAKQYRSSWQKKSSLKDGLEMLFGRMLTHHSCLIVLDNLESVIDENNCIPDEFKGLRGFIEACLEYDHAATLIATSRKTLVLSPEVEGRVVDRRVEFSLDEGLLIDDAAVLLRRLDPTGRLCIRDASNELLDEIARRCECIPRTIETLVGTLLQRRTWNISSLLSDDAVFSRLIENPARELYENLSVGDDRLVVKALSVYDKPVPSSAISHLFPTMLVNDVLDRLVRNYVISYDNDEFSLHALDQQYAYQQIPDLEIDYSKKELHKLAAGYFRTLRKPVEEWKSFADVESQVQEVQHFVSAGIFDSACKVLNNIDREYLALWDYYQLIIKLRKKLLGHVINEELQELNFGNLACAYFETGEPEKAIEYYELALSVARKSHNLAGICRWVGNIGAVHIGFKKYKEAKEYLEEAIGIAREIRNRKHEGRWLGKLSDVNMRLEPSVPQKVIKDYEEAIEIAREVDDKRFENIWLSTLGDIHVKKESIDEAIFYYVRASDVAEHNYDIKGQFRCIINVAECHKLLGQNDEQKKYYEQALEIARKVESTETEVELLISLGALCYSTNDGRSAIEYYQDALVVAERIGDIIQQAFATFNIADAFHFIGELENATNYYKKSLSFNNVLVNHRCECSLGTIFLQKDQIDQARSHYRQCLLICKEMMEQSNYLSPVNVYVVIAHLGLGEVESGLDTLQKGLKICSSKEEAHYALQDLSVLKRVPQKIAGLEDATRFLEKRKEEFNVKVA